VTPARARGHAKSGSHSQYPSDSPEQDEETAQRDRERRRRTVTVAALRAGYAWSVRSSQAGAMLEVARMVGVVMEAFGPGHGPTDPVSLAALLRAPLGVLLTPLGADEAIARTALLDDAGSLTDAAYDLVSEYVMQLPDTEASVWLPTWTRMRADDIQRQAFQALTSRRSQADYVAGRRFLIEHPATRSADELRELISRTGLPASAVYADLAHDQTHRDGVGAGWWWQCSVCRWPMRIAGRTVRCRYQPHDAVFEIRRPGRDTRVPELAVVGEKDIETVPETLDAAGALCVDPGVWRHIVVPGCTEIRIYERLRMLKARDGSRPEVELWPDTDAFDLRVIAGAVFTADVKEYRSAARLIAALREKPTRAPVLLPRGHEWQKSEIKRALSVMVYDEDEFVAKVRSALRRKAAP
jgi:hypothetical protein